jgi:hypothetical protein
MYVYFFRYNTNTGLAFGELNASHDIYWDVSQFLQNAFNPLNAEFKRQNKILDQTRYQKKFVLFLLLFDLFLMLKMPISPRLYTN